MPAESSHFTDQELSEICDPKKSGPTVIKLVQEIYRLRAVNRGQVDSLNHWRKSYDEAEYLLYSQDLKLPIPPRLEARMGAWVESRLGIRHLEPRERAMRILEEAIELAQAVGIPLGMVQAQAVHTFDRMPGVALKEGASVAVCILGWCAAFGLNFEEIAGRELERLETQPVEEIQSSLKRKQEAGLITCADLGEAAHA